MRRLLDTPAGRPLGVTSAVMLAALVAAAIGLIVDPRVITGAPAWLKPAKFAISMAVYCSTLLWLLSFVRGHTRFVRGVAWVTAVTLLVEETIIVGQVVRGVPSHFNVSTPLDSTLFSIMGSTIVIAWVAGLVAAILLLRQRMADSVFGWALRLGLLISLVGMSLGFLMTNANPSQELAANVRAQAGLPITSGAHSVGVPAGDGGAGLPIVGWSTEGGDLRAPHFVGIHAINVLALIGWALSRSRLRRSARLGLVWTASLGYLSLVALLAWQALREQSLAAPDGLTLAAAGVLLATFSVATVAILASPTRGGATTQPGPAS